MKILHLSYHVGLINDVSYIFKQLGHTVDTKHITFPDFKVTDILAE
jgi:hypothetical protein